MDPKQETNVAAQPVVEDTTQASSPQAEVQPTDVQTPPNPTPDIEDSMSPEQRKAFQEMRIEKKRLEEQLQARQSNESAFAPFRPQVFDPNTAMDDSQRIRSEAAQAAQEVVDELMAKQKYPELFKDRETEQEIADRWFASKMRGENVSISDIAEKVNQRYHTAVTKAEQAGAKQALEQVTPKEQAALAATPSSSRAAQSQTSSEDFERLKVATRLGNEEAMVARMRAIPWANK